MREVFENTEGSDLRQISKYVTREIDRCRPRSILCHDLGVPMTLMSLLRIQREHPDYRPRVTAFNGAFRGVNPVTANTLLKMQFTTRKRAIAGVKAQGGDVDLGLTPYMPRIRALYRQLILFRVTEQLSATFGLDDLVGLRNARRLRTPLQVVASPDDPFLPVEAVRRLSRDFHARRLVEVPYGHFPYSVPRERLLPYVEDFERVG